ncbi:acyl carrier [Pyrrhoderma noxium]|uniref:Acyl carrier protein n=1 Tax=Pyrrhoderma noxium TaxID=2282107 RepID=A0A286USX8_9AGAM|nr:acyl carrier [Pyrrhoderma noxium]
MSFLRAAARSVARPHAVSAPFRSAQLANARYTFALQRASYSAAAGLSRSDIESRVLDVLKSFEKVNQTKLTASSSFTEDLGLDSLDAVEVVMAVEEEFAIEIPDAEADEIKTVKQAIDYIAKTPDAK